jgi:hypothetical protein
MAEPIIVASISVLCGAIKAADKLIELRESWRSAPSTLVFILDKSSLVRSFLVRLRDLLEGGTFTGIHLSNEQQRDFLNTARSCETTLHRLDAEVSKMSTAGIPECPGAMQAQDKAKYIWQENRLRNLVKQLDSYIESLISALVLFNT